MKKAAARKPARPARKPRPRADLGAPVDGFFARQPPAPRPILDELRKVVGEAESSLKWGMRAWLRAAAGRARAAK